MHLRTISRDYVFLAVGGVRGGGTMPWFILVLHLSEFHAMHLCFHWFAVGLATLTICSCVVILDCYKITCKIFIYILLDVKALSSDVRRYYKYIAVIKVLIRLFFQFVMLTTFFEMFKMLKYFLLKYYVLSLDPLNVWSWCMLCVMFVHMAIYGWLLLLSAI